MQQCATEQSRAELEEATQRTAHYLALGAAGALLAYLQQVSFFPCALSCILAILPKLAAIWAAAFDRSQPDIHSF